MYYNYVISSSKALFIMPYLCLQDSDAHLVILPECHELFVQENEQLPLFPTQFILNKIHNIRN